MKPEVVYGNETAVQLELKVEAVKLVTERGVAVAQAACDLDVHETRLSAWMRELTADSLQAFPGKGVMKPEQTEIERLRKEVAKIKMERDILKKPRPSSPRSRCEVRLRCETPRDLAGESDVRGARYLAKWLLRPVGETTQPTQPE